MRYHVWNGYNLLNYPKSLWERLVTCIQVNLDIVSKIGVVVCFNSMFRSVNILRMHLNFMRDVWILSAYLNARHFNYGGIPKTKPLCPLSCVPSNMKLNQEEKTHSEQVYPLVNMQW